MLSDHPLESDVRDHRAGQHRRSVPGRTGGLRSGLHPGGRHRHRRSSAPRDDDSERGRAARPTAARRSTTPSTWPEIGSTSTPGLAGSTARHGTLPTPGALGIVVGDNFPGRAPSPMGRGVGGHLRRHGDFRERRPEVQERGREPVEFEIQAVQATTGTRATGGSLAGSPTRRTAARSSTCGTRTATATPGKVSDEEYHLLLPTTTAGCTTTLALRTAAFAILGSTAAPTTARPSTASASTRRPPSTLRGQSQYLIPSSDFPDMADALLASCDDLTGQRVVAAHRGAEAADPTLTGPVTAANCADLGKGITATEMTDNAIEDVWVPATPRPRRTVGVRCRFHHHNRVVGGLRGRARRLGHRPGDRLRGTALRRRGRRRPRLPGTTRAAGGLRPDARRWATARRRPATSPAVTRSSSPAVTVPATGQNPLARVRPLRGDRARLRRRVRSPTAATVARSPPCPSAAYVFNAAHRGRCQLDPGNGRAPTRSSGHAGVDRHRRGPEQGHLGSDPGLA